MKGLGGVRGSRQDSRVLGVCACMVAVAVHRWEETKACCCTSHPHTWAPGSRHSGRAPSPPSFAHPNQLMPLMLRGALLA